MKQFFSLLFIFFATTLKAQTGIITTICGDGSGGDTGDGGLAISAEISASVCGIFDVFGNYYFNELNHKIRKIAPTGIITTVAGTGTAGFSGDGFSAVSAKLNNPLGITTDTLGNLYIADAKNFRVRKVDVSTGIITTYAGNGGSGYSGDGLPATSAAIDYPYAVCMDRFGNLYIASQTYSVIRKVDPSGVISTIAGTPGISGLTGDGGLATAAEIGGVEGLYCDRDGNIYLAGFNVRKIDVTTGIISLTAGADTPGYNGDGIPATAAALNQVVEVSINYKNGLLYIADRRNNRIRQIDSARIITTVVGNGTMGFSGDGGKDTAAELSWPQGIAFDSCGNMYIVDLNNYRIRKVTYPILPSTISVSGPALAAIGSTVTCTATVTNVGTKYSIQWMNHGTVFATTSVPSVSYTKTKTIDNITAAITPTACFDTASSEAITVSSTTEGAGIPGVQPINIYPIPATDLLHIDNLQSPAGYRLLTIVGATMQQGTLTTGNNRISIQSVPNGLYLLEVTATSLRGTVSSLSSGEGRGEVKTTTKIIKQ